MCKYSFIYLSMLTMWYVLGVGESYMEKRTKEFWIRSVLMLVEATHQIKSFFLFLIFFFDGWKWNQVFFFFFLNCRFNIVMIGIVFSWRENFFNFTRDIKKMSGLIEIFISKKKSLLFFSLEKTIKFVSSIKLLTNKA